VPLHKTNSTTRDWINTNMNHNDAVQMRALIEQLAKSLSEKLDRLEQRVINVEILVRSSYDDIDERLHKIERNQKHHKRGRKRRRHKNEPENDESDTNDPTYDPTYDPTWEDK
jgi:hypothetical protein